MQLVSKRLSYKQLSSNDWELFYNLHTDKSVIKYISNPLSEQQIREKFETRLLPWNKESDGWLCLVITEVATGRNVGLTGFFSTWSANKQAELGFMLNPNYQGNGYGFESTEFMLKLAFNYCQFHKVSATVTKGNDASFGLLQKLGLKLEGVLRENFLLNGSWKDDLKLGILDTESVSI